MDRFDLFCTYFPDPTWSDLLFGIGRGWIPANRAILRAGDYILECPDKETETLRRLAFASPSEHALVVRRLEELSFEESAETRDRATRRWRYLFLLEALTTLEAEKLLEGVESVWCDFEHPQDLAPFIPWMPHSLGEPAAPHGNWHEWAAQRFREFMTRERQDLS